MGLVAMDAAVFVDQSGIGPAGAAAGIAGTKHAFSKTSLHDGSDRAETASVHAALADADETSEEGRRLRPTLMLRAHALQGSKPSRDADQRNGRLGTLLPERPPRA